MRPALTDYEQVEPAMNEPLRSLEEQENNMLLDLRVELREQIARKWR